MGSINYSESHFMSRYVHYNLTAENIPSEMLFGHVLLWLVPKLQIVRRVIVYPISLNVM